MKFVKMGVDEYFAVLCSVWSQTGNFMNIGWCEMRHGYISLISTASTELTSQFMQCTNRICYFRLFGVAIVRTLELCLYYFQYVIKFCCIIHTIIAVRTNYQLLSAGVRDF